MYYKMEFLCRQKNGFLVIRTFEAVPNAIPEKSIKHTMNEMYRTIFIRLRMIITRVIRSIENGANSRINFQNSG